MKRMMIRTAVVVFLLGICGAVPVAADGGNPTPMCRPPLVCTIQ